jgi:uncharacterized protein (TIGR00299 family) protein
MAWLSVLYFDCFSGASGDMVLGALIDAGVPLAEARTALGGLAIDPEAVWTERVLRAGVSATRFCVRGEDAPVEPPRPKDHSHPHQRSHEPADDGGTGDAHRSALAGGGDEHRSLVEIFRLIDRSGLSQSARSRAKELFTRLGEAEAAIHNLALDEVHLHEVGALDSVIDIVGAVFALERLGADRFVSSPLNLGSGTVTSAHGHYPVPAPATLRLLKGAPVYAGPQQRELVTPTGALLISSYASSYGALPPMRLQRVGYGAGSRDLPERPNVLRVVIGDEDDTGGDDLVVVTEAEIDDMNPQIFGVVMDALLSAGALDVFYTPIQMKKNRPGTLLTVISRPADRERLTAHIFRETTTIGVRYRQTNRECLDRRGVSVETPYGAVTMKVASRHGEILNAAPEFDECLRLARESGVPLKDVQSAAIKAFLDHRRP